MDGESFEATRRTVLASGPPSAGDDLLGMEIDCCAFFGDPAYADDPTELWQGMEIVRRAGTEWLIQGRATGRRTNAQAIARSLAAIWEERLRYAYYSAHTTDVTPDRVTLRALTQIAEGGFWVTAEIEVALT